MSLRGYQNGEEVAAFDRNTREWVSARVVCAHADTLVLQTSTWWAVFPSSPRFVLPMRVLP